MATSSVVSGCLFVLLALSIFQTAHGHGYLQLPKSRNYIANLQGRDFCPHCLSAGGPGTTQPLTPGGLYPNPTETTASSVRHAMCGEAANVPASQRVYNPSPVPSIATLPVYAAGAEFDMTVVITAHHRGHFEFRMCDAAQLSDPTTVTWQCLNQHVLQRVAVAGEVSPVDTNHPERYYLEPECSPDYNKTITMKYKMPAAVTCERCVIQWWWVSANTCNPPGYAARSVQPAHVATGCAWWEPNLPLCSTAYPEEFWNCADVRVVGNGTPQPAVVNAEPQPAVVVVAPAVPAPAVPAIPVAPAVPVAPVQLACANLGWQCGGSTWTGTTCCAAGSCLAYIPEYSECRVACPAGWLCNTAAQQPVQPAVPAVPAPAPAVPAPAPAVPAPAPLAPAVPAPVVPAPLAPKPAVPAVPKPAAPTPAVPATTTQTCAANGFQCGGSGWTGTTCCAAGTTCQAYLATYSMCRIGACPAGWLCNSEKSLMTQAVDWVKAFAL